MFNQERRLYNQIIKAFNNALHQEDLEMCIILNQALELSLTRKTGGPDFVERRDVPPNAFEAFTNFAALKEKLGDKHKEPA